MVCPAELTGKVDIYSCAEDLRLCYLVCRATLLSCSCLFFFLFNMGRWITDHLMQHIKLYTLHFGQCHCALIGLNQSEDTIACYY